MSDKSSLGAQPGSEIIGIAMESFGDWLEAHPWTEGLDIEDQADVYRQWCDISRLTAENARLAKELEAADAVIAYASSKIPFFGDMADAACRALDRHEGK